MLGCLAAIDREAETLEVLLTTIEGGTGHDPHLNREINDLKSAFARREDIESRARQIVEQCALLLQAVLLIEAGNPSIADAFIQARLCRRSGIYGTPLNRQTTESLIQRAMPTVD